MLNIDKIASRFTNKTYFLRLLLQGIIVSDNPTKYKNDNNANNINLKILVNGDRDDNRLVFYIVDEFRRQIIISADEWTSNFKV
jgi:hypothetical protein